MSGFRDFDEAWAHLRATTNYESQIPSAGVLREWKLARTRRSLRELGDPQHEVRWAHVAGSKGKGSTCLFLGSILRSAHRRTGVYTSPHLSDIRERISLDGVPIARDLFARYLGPVADLSERWVREGRDRLTFFEAMTALAIVAFAREGIEWGVLETGLGGRLDATNAVRPDVAVLTLIELEHERLLGSTVAAIAGEKAGIVKRGVPVVCAPQSPEALDVIERVARQRGAPLALAGRDILWLPEAGPERALRTPWGEVARVRLSVEGEHAWGNAALAGACALRLGVGAEAVGEGLSRCALPGRCERLGERLLVDGAHTIRSAEALVRVLERLGWDRVALVYGTHEDKRYPEILDRLAPRASRAWLVGLGGPRGVASESLVACAHAAGIARAEAAPNLATAYDEAAATGLPVVVTGSVYLAGAARDLALRSAARSSAAIAPSAASSHATVR